MNVVAITVISVVGTALFAMFFMQFQGLREDIRGLDHKFTGELRALDHKFTGEFKALDQKFTGELRALDHKFTVEFKAVYGVLREHGERLARIESKLEIDPPAEAA